MQQFPVELWEKIGRDACLDGGYIGCALSLVCRDMRHAMRRIRFISIAITSEKSCLVFAQQLRHATPTSPCQHLFIWFPSTPEELSQASLIDACNHILSYAAPTLVTLSLHSLALSGVIGSNISFPNLRDLCAPRHYILHRGPWIDARTFPAIQRLHIDGSGYDGMRASIEFWQEIAHFTTLIALRLTGVRREHKLPAFLRTLLRAPVPPKPRTKRRAYLVHGRLEEFVGGSPDAVQSLQIAARLPGLMYITTQPMSSVGHRWCGNGHAAHRNMVASLTAIAEATSPRNTGSRRLWNMQSSAEYSCEEALYDWSDVLDGGDGPWPPGSSHYARSYA